MKALFREKVLLVGVKAERAECARRLESRGHRAEEIAARLGSFEREVEALAPCDVVLNNADDNREKIDRVVRILREGLNGAR